MPSKDTGDGNGAPVKPPSGGVKSLASEEHEEHTDPTLERTGRYY